MIIEYHRPKTIESALELLARPQPRTLPLGGGTILNRPSPEAVAVVDLQALNLDGLRVAGNNLLIGATVTLARLAEWEGLPPALIKALGLELTYNLRQAATVAGALVSADGRSGFAATMLALDATVDLVALDEAVGLKREKVRLGDLLPLRIERLRGKLITQVQLPLNVWLSYEYVARTPADLPILCVALAGWRSGRRRVVVGGFGDLPRLAMDGPSADGVEVAAQATCASSEDEWASAAYRSEVAGVLARRCLENLSMNEQG